MNRIIKKSLWLLCGGFILTAATAMIFFNLPQSNWKTFSVQTGSMVPTIKPGSLVFIYRMPVKNIKTGDIITYLVTGNKHQTITHRVHSIQSENGLITSITTKGDANSTADPPINPRQVVGVMRFHAPLLGKVSDATRTPIGLLLLIYIPAIMLVTSEMRLLIKRLQAAEQTSPIHRNTIPMPLSRNLRPQLSHPISPYVINISANNVPPPKAVDTIYKRI